MVRFDVDCRKLENIIYEDDDVESECNYQHLDRNYFNRTLMLYFVFFFIMMVKIKSSIFSL